MFAMGLYYKSIKTNTCVVGNEYSDTSTVLSSMIPLDPKEWEEHVSAAEYAYNKVKSNKYGIDADYNLLPKLASIIVCKGTAMDFLPVMFPDLGITVSTACKIETELED